MTGLGVALGNFVHVSRDDETLDLGSAFVDLVDLGITH